MIRLSYLSRSRCCVRGYATTLLTCALCGCIFQTPARPMPPCLCCRQSSPPKLPAFRHRLSPFPPLACRLSPRPLLTLTPRHCRPWFFPPHTRELPRRGNALRPCPSPLILLGPPQCHSARVDSRGLHRRPLHLPRRLRQLRPLTGPLPPFVDRPPTRRCLHRALDSRALLPQLHRGRQRSLDGQQAPRRLPAPLSRPCLHQVRRHVHGFVCSTVCVHTCVFGAPFVRCQHACTPASGLQLR